MELTVLADITREICTLTERGDFVPLLEADLNCFLYHIMLERSCCLPKDIHADCRVIGSKGFFDIALGQIGMREEGRAAVIAEVAIELKVFPRGFSQQQHRVHLGHILHDDLPKLGALTHQPLLAAGVIFDEYNYLQGSYKNQNRVESVVACRNRVAPKAAIIIARKAPAGWGVNCL